jgi:hypothetical protein
MDAIKLELLLWPLSAILPRLAPGPANTRKYPTAYGIRRQYPNMVEARFALGLEQERSIDLVPVYTESLRDTKAESVREDLHFQSWICWLIRDPQVRT